MPLRHSCCEGFIQLKCPTARKIQSSKGWAPREPTHYKDFLLSGWQLRIKLCVFPFHYDNLPPSSLTRRMVKVKYVAIEDGDLRIVSLQNQLVISNDPYVEVNDDR